MELLGEEALKVLEPYKRPSAGAQDPYDEAQPITRAYEWMVAANPVKSEAEGGVLRRVSPNELGMFALIFQLDDFRNAVQEYMPRIYDAVKGSQSPERRRKAILLTYGVELGGPQNMKRALMVLSLAMAKDRREGAGF